MPKYSIRFGKASHRKPRCPTWCTDKEIVPPIPKRRGISKGASRRRLGLVNRPVTALTLNNDVKRSQVASVPEKRYFCGRDIFYIEIFRHDERAGFLDWEFMS